jgi:hypothetical protein
MHAAHATRRAVVNASQSCARAIMKRTIEQVRSLEGDSALEGPGRDDLGSAFRRLLTGPNELAEALFHYPKFGYEGFRLFVRGSPR